MHLIVVVPDEHDIPDTEAAAWASVLSALEPTWRVDGGRDTLSTPAELAAAQLLLGRPTTPEEDGRLPWVAWQRGEADPWASLTLCHGLVGADRITALPPAALGLDIEESRALFDSVAPLFASEGVDLLWHDAQTWHLRHESLRDLPCASLARVVGDSMQQWQGRTPLTRCRLLRRLQNEAQMVLHAHPVNAARSERHALTVNALWMGQAGAGDQLGPSPTPAEMAQRLAALNSLDFPGAAARVAQALTPAFCTLVLAGSAQAQAFSPKPGVNPAWSNPMSSVDAGSSPVDPQGRRPWWARLLGPLARWTSAGDAASAHGPAGGAPGSIREWSVRLHRGTGEAA